MITVAFHYMGGNHWPAGEVVLELIAAALRSVPDKKIKTTLAVWENIPSETYTHLLPLFDSKVILPSDTDKKPDAVSQALDNAKIDVYFSIPTDTASAINKPLLLWLYDFQHMRHPENFSNEEQTRMNRVFTQSAKAASRILVYSKAAQSDLQLFMPQVIEKARLIRFEPHIPETATTGKPADICRLHNLPERFIYLPNRFKPYKNHNDVLAALHVLSKKNIKPTVVCTGENKGECFEDLIRERDKAGLQNQFLTPGLLERKETFSLLRQCAALLNPSGFEGFGLSVAEAKALGKPMILSDLPVFREHNLSSARFFPTGDIEALARALADIWENKPHGPAKDESIHIEKWKVRQILFGRKLSELFKEIHNATIQ